MANRYRPALPFKVPLVLLVPTTTTVKGVPKKTFPTVEEALETKRNLFYASFKTYGGTERKVNDLYSIEDTANIETWFRPDVKSNCRIARAVDGAIYEIINEPENVYMEDQFLIFKVRRVKGGV